MSINTETKVNKEKPQDGNLHGSEKHIGSSENKEERKHDLTRKFVLNIY